MGSHHFDARWARGKRPSGGRVRPSARLLAGACTCCTAGAAGLLVGLATEDTLVEVISPAVYNAATALLFWGRGFIRSIGRRLIGRSSVKGGARCGLLG